MADRYFSRSSLPTWFDPIREPNLHSVYLDSGPIHHSQIPELQVSLGTAVTQYVIRISQPETISHANLRTVYVYCAVWRQLGH